MCVYGCMCVYESKGARVCEDVCTSMGVGSYVCTCLFTSTHGDKRTASNEPPEPSTLFFGTESLTGTQGSLISPG